MTTDTERIMILDGARLVLEERETSVYPRERAIATLLVEQAERIAGLEEALAKARKTERFLRYFEVPHDSIIERANRLCEVLADHEYESLAEDVHADVTQLMRQNGELASLRDTAEKARDEARAECERLKAENEWLRQRFEAHHPARGSRPDDLTVAEERLDDICDGITKIKLDLSDPNTREVWETCLAAKREVESWPAWKRGEPTAAGGDK